MTINLRSKRQEEFSELFIQENKDGILYLCPRFGKCRTAINIFKKLGNINILICYPDKSIKDSWKEEFKITNFDDSYINFSTYASLHKISSPYDLIILDEIQNMSDNQINILRNLKRKYDSRLLGLSGTLSQWTQTYLKRMLKLDIIAEYSLEKAIQENILPDYKINIKIINLDNKIKVKFGNKIKTEKQHFDSYSYIIEKLQEEKKDTTFLKLARMRILQKSLAKRVETINLIKKFNSERILVFCGLTDIADSLNIPSYHSKNKNKNYFDQFKIGIGSHIAVVDIGGIGVTYKPLNKVIINYFDSNPENLAQKIFRCMSIEYNNPNKKADIWIICTNEEVEKKWLNKSLEFFNKEKIFYLN